MAEQAEPVDELDVLRAEAASLGLKIHSRATRKYVQAKIDAHHAAQAPASNVSVGIMAHRRREHFVERLVAQMPGADVTWDEREDRWDTGRRAMLAYDPAAAWRLVVQDDALLCRDFLPGVEKALACVPPDNPVSFYAGRVRPAAAFVAEMCDAAVREGRSWFAMKGPWWGVAIAIPTKHIPAMVEWCDQRSDIANYDRRISRYFESAGLDCWYSVPSLVDHRIGSENPSLIPHRSSSDNRVAYRFIGDASPLDVNWATEPVRALPPSKPLSGRLTSRRWRHAIDGRERSTTVGSQLDARCVSDPNWQERV